MRLVIQVVFLHGRIDPDLWATDICLTIRDQRLIILDGTVATCHVIDRESRRDYVHAAITLLAREERRGRAVLTDARYVIFAVRKSRMVLIVHLMLQPLANRSVIYRLKLTSSTVC